MITLRPVAHAVPACGRTAAAMLLVLWPWGADAQPSRQTMQSVVRITCTLPAGAGVSAAGGGTVMNATGFVWPDASHVVTALHAVAGCKSLSVFSEATGATASASVERVILEADIAWLTLGKVLGVPPGKTGSVPQDGAGSFFVVGYPWGGDVAKGDPVTFSVGMKGAVTTLDKAYGNVPDMRELFTGGAQTYPQSGATILRVGSTLQPGHSGAPIFDGKGLVVAIADGGLFKGFAGMNWSMPVDPYLQRLMVSPDRKPDNPSVWAVRFSTVNVAPSQPLALPPEVAAAATEARVTEVRRIDLSPGEFRRVRRVPLDMLAERLRAENKGQPDANIEFMRGLVATSADFDKLAFDIYEDPWTGATIGVPSQAVLSWNPNRRALMALSPDGGARMIFGLFHGKSHAEARDVGRKALIGKTQKMADAWKQSHELMDYTNVTPPADNFSGWASGSRSFDGRVKATGQEVSMLLSMSVLGNNFLGFGVLGPKDITNGLSRPDLVAYLMMQMAGNNLSDFARQ